MRTTRFPLLLLCGALFLFTIPDVVLAQPGGGPPGGGGGWQGGGRGGRGGDRGGRGGGGGRGDPNMFFNLLSGGKDYIVVADLLANPMITAHDPNAKERIEAFMQKQGITDGRLTREQFALYMQERMAERAAANPGGAASAAAPSAGAADAGDATEAPPEEEKRQVVYRAGNLPKELPPWFAQLDEDKDGQVGLYEWKKAGRSISEFEAMDLNGDGFITVEEALRYVKSEGKNVASAGSSPGFSGRPSFGGSPGMGGPPSGGGSSYGGPPSFGGPPSDRGQFSNRGRGSFGPPGAGPPGGSPGDQGDFRRRRRQRDQ